MPKTFEYKDPRRLELIEELKKTSKDNEADVWKAVARELSRTRKDRKEVNIRSLNRHTSANDTVVVPGKLLGDGDLDHKVNVAAFKVSEAARSKVEGAGGKILFLRDLLKKNPKGSKIRIVG